MFAFLRRWGRPAPVVPVPAPTETVAAPAQPAGWSLLPDDLTIPSPGPMAPRVPDDPPRLFVDSGTIVVLVEGAALALAPDDVYLAIMPPGPSPLSDVGARVSVSAAAPVYDDAPCHGRRLLPPGRYLVIEIRYHGSFPYCYLIRAPDEAGAAPSAYRPLADPEAPP